MRPRHTQSSRLRATVWSSLSVLAVVVLTACGAGSSGAQKTVTVPPSTSASSTPAAAASTSDTPTPSPSPTGAPVHVKLLESDQFGPVTYGVGMPIIAYFSAMITDPAPFMKATTVKVNGADAGGTWYFEKSASIEGYPLEGHYRPKEFWPAHASIKMNMPVQGLSAGTGLVYDDSLTLNMATGAANISTVDANSLQMTVTTDGVAVKTLPVSLGKAKTPTYNGTKIVMQKGSTGQPDGTVRMIGPGYNELVKWSVRITNSGEYVHAAPWNSKIGQVSTSNGCTNMDVADAQYFYNLAQIGDPIIYTNTNGGQMPEWDGYGDWNVSWAQWQQGGEVSTAT